MASRDGAASALAGDDGAALLQRGEAVGPADVEPSFSDILLILCFVNYLSAVSAVRIRPVGLGFLPFERWSIS